MHTKIDRAHKYTSLYTETDL